MNSIPIVFLIFLIKISLIVVLIYLFLCRVPLLNYIIFTNPLVEIVNISFFQLVLSLLMFNQGCKHFLKDVHS